MRFEIGTDDFLLDGEPHRIVSGALHYFRVHPGLWADRIHKARLMGLNTIETYVAWNAHETRPGSFTFDGGLDLGHFLDLVAAEGMHAIVRPGPYICAEWANGGLPSWLFAADDGAGAPVGVRRDEPQFLAAVSRYLDALAPILVPRQVDAGGPIVLVQVENEYGAYGSDATYLRKLLDMHRAIGLTVPFTSVDQPLGTMLEDGSLPELHRTGSFGSRVTERLARLRAAQPTGPLMCSEFWDGWFDSWGEHHHTTSAAESAAELDTLLAAGASVNVYMFHGGTNFGFTNGANDKGVYRPITTSYDYDAPLDEAGLPTEKFHAFRAAIAKYEPVPDLPPDLAAPASDADGLEARGTPATIARVRMGQDRLLADLLPELATWSAHDEVPTMDALGVAAGFVLYRTEIDAPDGGVLTVDEVRDRAQVFLGGRAVGVLEREDHDRAIVLPPARHAVLDLLVEDQGRVDYGPRIGEPKGLIGPVRLDGVDVGRWTVTPVDLQSIVDAVPDRSAPDGGGAGDDSGSGVGAGDDAGAAPAADDAVAAVPVPIAGPVLVRGVLDLDEPRDLHLELDGFGKGVAWVNGFSLGRYWSRGPQHTLYVTGPVLRAGANDVAVFVQHAAVGRDVVVRRTADLGHTED